MRKNEALEILYQLPDIYLPADDPDKVNNIDYVRSRIKKCKKAILLLQVAQELKMKNAEALNIINVSKQGGEYILNIPKWLGRDIEEALENLEMEVCKWKDREMQLEECVSIDVENKINALLQD